jgi:hypothetical protein
VDSQLPSEELCQDCKAQPSDEWPEAAAMIAEIVRYAGTDWVRKVCDEIESESRDE